MFQGYSLMRSMRRSGSHAVMQWIIAASGWVFLNNVLNVDRFFRQNMAVPNQVGFHRTLWAMSRKPRGIWPNGQANSRWGALRTFFRHHLLLGLEDHDLRFRVVCGGRQAEADILVVRNPANMFASRLRRQWPCAAMDTDEKRARNLNLWKSYAREFLGDTRILPNKVGVCFDLWFVSEDYRESIARKLDIPFTDRFRTKVASFGGGSSFDGDSENLDGLTLAVLDRFERLQQPERAALSPVLADPELWSLWTRILETLSEFKGAEDLPSFRL